MALKTAPQPVKPVTAASIMTPEMQTFASVKLGRPRSFWRFVNRVIAYGMGEISRDEWDLAYGQALKFVEGKAMFPEDAARRAEKIIDALLDSEMTHAAVAKCEGSDKAILIAFFGQPASGFFHSRAFTLLDPKGAKRG